MKKRSNKIIISLIIILLIILIGFVLYFVLAKKEPKVEEVKVLKSIEGYNYNLKENETLLYKEEFNNLESILKSDNVDFNEYAKSVAKLFIIDFYTLDNKLSKNDIGGVEFIKDDMKNNFIEEARSTFYRYVEVKNDNRTQKLPIVSEITNVNVSNTEFKYKDKTVDKNAYRVDISWDYEEDLGYEKEAKMILVKDDKKLYIVEMN